MRIDNERLIAAAKAVLGDDYLDSDEEFLDWANENYHSEARNWEEFARKLVAFGGWHEVPPEVESCLDYKSIGEGLSHDFYMADGLVFFQY